MAEPVLTVGMLTYDDFDGVYFTIQSIRINHCDVANKIRFLIIDNNPGSDQGKALAATFGNNKDVSYYPLAHSNFANDKHDFKVRTSSTSLRNLVFELAETPYVLCLDGHVLLQPKSLERLIRFYEANPQCHDLIQGPLFNEAGSVIATSMQPNFRGGNFGTWTEGDKRCDDPAGDPYEIPMHGMGLFACTQAGWPRFGIGMRGFGGEEGTIHERFRLLGRKCWVVPFLGWTHRFARPGGVPYKIDLTEKIRNLIREFRSVALPTDIIKEYFRDKLDSNPKKAQVKLDEFSRWEQTLPVCSFNVPADYKPFLDTPIKILSNKK